MSDQVTICTACMYFSFYRMSVTFLPCANPPHMKIIGRIDEMGGRIDDLEKSIGDLMEQASAF
jgi:hypothetical protein